MLMTVASLEVVKTLAFWFTGETHRTDWKLLYIFTVTVSYRERMQIESSRGKRLPEQHPG